MPNAPDPLRAKLRVWQVDPPAEGGFRPAVWARIGARRRELAETWFGYFRRHAVAWSLAVAVSAGVAGLLGNLVGERRAAADHAAILGTYLAQIDARAMQH